MAEESRPVMGHGGEQTCPRSAVGHGVGLAGLAGLALWTWFAWREGLDGAPAGIVALLACATPMLLWSLLVDKVHRNPTTGIDWTRAPRPIGETLEISLVKLAGLWVTWWLVALFYGIGHWYWQGDYLRAMRLFGWSLVPLMLLSVAYILWLDRRLIEPRDDCYVFGRWLVGRLLPQAIDWGAKERRDAVASGAGEAQDAPAAAAAPMAPAASDTGVAPAPDAMPSVRIARHLRAWAVKAFFLAFMVSITPGNFVAVIGWRLADPLGGPANLATFLIALLFMVDVVFATIGYVLTLRPLDAHIRSANPYLAGWLAALICYPPFVLMGDGGPLDYHRGTASWSVWFAGNVALMWGWCAVLVMLTAVYAWATVAFGLRFSNLTHRGILTHGPYRWSRHPAYLSKNLFWWLSVLPFLPTGGSWLEAGRNCALLGLTSAVYYWRARTEERHLAEDPVYRAYFDWMERHGPVPRLVARLTGWNRSALATPPESR